MIKFTGEELRALAKERVNNEMIDSSCTAIAFREFLRTFIFMSTSTAMTEGPGEFNYTLMISTPDGRMMDVVIEVKMKAFDRSKQ